MLSLRWRWGTLMLLAASSLLAQQGADPALSETTVLCELPAGPPGLSLPTRSLQKPFLPPKSATLSITTLGEGDYVRGRACVAFPGEAVAALTYAAELWIDELKITQPLSIETCFSPDLPEATLAVASAPTYVVTGGRALGEEALLYPQAILEALDGREMGDMADMTIVFNDRSPFFYGIEPYDIINYQYDFVSLALHEIGHGLGFFGLAKLDEHGPRIGQMRSIGPDRGSQRVPTVFDRAVMLGRPDIFSVLDLVQNEGALKSALLGKEGGLFFDSGELARYANSTERTQLYTPEPFRKGSSYSHADDPNHLMSHNFQQGSAARRSLGPTAAVLGALGWAGEAEVAAPVAWTSFTARATEAGVVLDWATATETDNAGFTVQHSSDGSTFTAIGEVAGRGTTTVPQDYTFTDPTPTAGLQYYRLLQTDYDGTSALSDVVAVTATSGGERAVPFPNPVGQGTDISLMYRTDTPGPLSLRLYTATGRLVYERRSAVAAGAQLLTVPTTGVPPGVYSLQLTDGRQRSAYRLRVQR